MREIDKKIVMEFKERLPRELSEKLKKLIVFGSRAKEASDEDSDLDLAALVSNKTPEIEKKLEDEAYNVMWNHDFKPIISLKVFSESRFNESLLKGLSFYENIEKEGIEV